MKIPGLKEIVLASLIGFAGCERLEENPSSLRELYLHNQIGSNKGTVRIDVKYGTNTLGSTPLYGVIRNWIKGVSSDPKKVVIRLGNGITIVGYDTDSDGNLEGFHHFIDEKKLLESTEVIYDSIRTGYEKQKTLEQ